MYICRNLADYGRLLETRVENESASNSIGGIVNIVKTVELNKIPSL